MKQTQSAPMFEIDVKGFKQIYQDRPAIESVFEIISNAFDAANARVSVRIEAEKIGPPAVSVYVEDDGPGFTELSDAWTVFGSSKKKSDPTQRGRFCFGEKWVAACAQRLVITTTCGTVSFYPERGTREVNEHMKQGSGTIVKLVLYSRDTEADVKELRRQVAQIIPPHGIKLERKFQHADFGPLRRVGVADAVLPTIVSDADGVLRTRQRATKINIYRVDVGEPKIFEMGIPITTHSGIYHYDIQQRVPLSVSRDTVPESYMKKVHAAALNVTADLLRDEEVTATGVTAGLEGANPVAIQTVLDKRFGKDRFVSDFNREAVLELTAKGSTAVAPATFDKGTWAAIKEAGAIKSATALYDTSFDASGSSQKINPSTEHLRFESFAIHLFKLLLDRPLKMTWVDAPKAQFQARCFGVLPEEGGTVTIEMNVGLLAENFFQKPGITNQPQVDLLLHEFAHHACEKDCTRAFVNEVTRLAAKLVAIVSKNTPFASAVYGGPVTFDK